MSADLLVCAETGAATVPALIAGAGERAAWRFLEFFTVNIRNKATRTRGRPMRGPLALSSVGAKGGIGEMGRVQPMHVAAYIELLQGERSPRTVKQHLACIRMLFDWLVTGQVMPSNPAHSVRGRVIR